MFSWPFLLLEACELLGTEAESLKQCLSLRRITTGSTGERFMKPCSKSECVERRDCMAKLIYSRYKILSGVSMKAGNRAKWPAVRTILPAFFDHVEESSSYKEVLFKKFCPPVKPVAFLLKMLMKPLHCTGDWKSLESRVYTRTQADYTWPSNFTFLWN